MSFVIIPFRRGFLSRNKTSTNFFNRSYTTSEPAALTGYRKYAQQFKSKPGSYMTTFAILHELTAIAPFPFIYWVLDASSINIPFPDAVVNEGNKFINKARVYYKYPPLEPDNRVMINLVTTYCIVKVITITAEAERERILTHTLGNVTSPYCRLSCNDSIFCRTFRRTCSRSRT